MNKNNKIEIKTKVRELSDFQFLFKLFLIIFNLILILYLAEDRFLLGSIVAILFCINLSNIVDLEDNAKLIRYRKGE